MMDVLPYLSWDLAVGLALLLAASLAIRRWGGAAGLRLGAALVWGAMILAAIWAGFSIYQAATLLVG